MTSWKITRLSVKSTFEFSPRKTWLRTYWKIYERMHYLYTLDDNRLWNVPSANRISEWKFKSNRSLSPYSEFFVQEISNRTSDNDDIIREPEIHSGAFSSLNPAVDWIRAEFCDCVTTVSGFNCSCRFQFIENAKYAWKIREISPSWFLFSTFFKAVLIFSN